MMYIHTVHIYVPCSERPLVHIDSIGSLVKQAEDNEEEEEEVRIVKMESSENQRLFLPVNFMCLTQFLLGK